GATFRFVPTVPWCARQKFVPKSQESAVQVTEKQNRSLLTDAQRAFFREHGYLVVENVVSAEDCARAAEAVWEFAGLDADDPTSWRKHHAAPGGFVNLVHHQALWNNRQNPKVHAVFSELLGTDKLWVSFDRCALKLPERAELAAREDGAFLHFDVDVRTPPSSLQLQGVLYLVDTTEDMGGFQCVPRSHEWTAFFASNFDYFFRGGGTVRDLPKKRVAARAGDLIVFNSLLLHGNGVNTSAKPRLAQYVTMFPAEPDNAAARKSRIEAWQTNGIPDDFYVPGKLFPPTEPHEAPGGPVARLTSLGQRLLGLEPW
ncbi:MAG TPA: phytanoyl-CoA dioxygenase family protein, partial [Labilithrix sp.]|nr:phytanoyl-CoA dioxygenase family protein [Labilithrix sp.]